MSIAGPVLISLSHYLVLSLLHRSDSSFRFFVFFFVYICQFGVHVLQTIGIADWGTWWESSLCIYWLCSSTIAFWSSLMLSLLLSFQWLDRSFNWPEHQHPSGHHNVTHLSSVHCAVCGLAHHVQKGNTHDIFGYVSIGYCTLVLLLSQRNASLTYVWLILRISWSKRLQWLLAVD